MLKKLREWWSRQCLHCMNKGIVRDRNGGPFVISYFCDCPKGVLREIKHKMNSAAGHRVRGL